MSSANVGPDEPFGGEPVEEVADPETTGQIMQFRVVPAVGVDDSTPPQFLQLPAITPLPVATVTRQVAMIEKAGVGPTQKENRSRARSRHSSARSPTGCVTERLWMDPVTENPAVGATEIWEMYNTTADAHPMHIHEITFEVVNREGLVTTGEEGEVVAADPARRQHHPSGAVGESASRTRSSPIRRRSRG